MRLAASLAVFQYHLWDNYLKVVFIHPGTDFFILLVGMVAALTEARRIPQGNWGKYIAGRYLRIYVTFIPVFVLYLLSGRDTLSTEFVVKSFFFIPMNEPPMVGPTWMLALFLIFYWLFSIAFVFRRESVLIPIFAIWTLACVAVEFLEIKSPVFDAGVGIAFSIRNIGFVLGYFGGWLVRSRKVSARLGGGFFVIGVLGMIPSFYFLNLAGEDGVPRVFLYGFFMTLVATGLAALEQQGGWEKFMKWVTFPWLVWLGGTSYVLYLTHNMVLGVWDMLHPITVAQVPLIIVVVLAVATIGYQFWEKPVLDFLRRRLFLQNKLPPSDAAALGT